MSNLKIKYFTCFSLILLGLLSLRVNFSQTASQLATESPTQFGTTKSQPNTAALLIPTESPAQFSTTESPTQFSTTESPPNVHTSEETPNISVSLKNPPITNWLKTNAPPLFEWEVPIIFYFFMQFGS